MSFPSEWSQGLATTVTKVKKLAEEKQTSLYQATELLKISHPAFGFVCHTVKSSFTVKDTCEQHLKAFDDQFKKMIEQRKSDDPEDTQDSQLQECLKTLRKCICVNVCVCVHVCVSMSKCVYEWVCESML